jgi:hypothetical protein
MGFLVHGNPLSLVAAPPSIAPLLLPLAKNMLLIGLTVVELIIVIDRMKWAWVQL